MTSFVNINYSTQHPGVARVESALGAVKQLRQGFSGTRGLATLLLSAMAAAVMVVAYQVMDSVSEGHLLVMWIGVWAVAFAVLALFASAARNVAVRTRSGLDSWSRSIAEARADQRLWQAAKNDPRVMADVQMAISRNEVESAPVRAVPAAVAGRTVQFGSSILRAYQRNYL